MRLNEPIVVEQVRTYPELLCNPGYMREDADWAGY